jgi:hypothetical protein
VTLLRALAVLLLAAVGSLLLPPGPGDMGLRPDLLLLVALAAGLHGAPGAGVAAGIAAGLLGGLFTLEPYGFDAALLGACGLVGSKLRVYVKAGHPGVQAALAGSLAAVLGAGSGDIDAAAMVPALLAGAAATALAAPVVLFVLDAIAAFRGPRPPEGRPSLV